MSDKSPAGGTINWDSSGTSYTAAASGDYLWQASTTHVSEEGKSIKALSAGTFAIDEKKGIVEAFAAAIGNKDSVGDIVAPQAFDSSLQRRKPRVVWGHNWNEPVGKVIEIREVGPSDPRLPAKMKQAGVGGLYVKVQFNLASERGREAFASVAFFGEDQEWSIGYKTIKSQYDPNRQANVLTEVELYEVSPVLHGANQLTGTVSVKSDTLEETAETKVGRVTAGRNAAKLRQAMDLIQSVINDGMPETPEAGVEEKKSLDGAAFNPDGAEEGSLYVRMIEAVSTSSNDEVFVDGQKALSGLVLTGTAEKHFQMAGALKLMMAPAVEYGISLRVPSEKGLEAGPQEIKIYLPEVDDAASLSGELLAKMEEAGVTDVAFDSLDFYGVESKSFNEAILGK